MAQGNKVIGFTLISALKFNNIPIIRVFGSIWYREIQENFPLAVLSLEI